MIIFIIPFLIQFACNSEHDFQKINFNWSEDYLGEIAQGFDPEMKYDFWALVRTGIPNENSLKIMYQTNDDPLVELDDLFQRGFYHQGHISNVFYYIVTVKDGKDSYFTDTNSLLRFLGKVNTMEEAVMIAKINGFGIDNGNPKGSSFRKTDNGFEFLLMKSEGPGLIEFRQYLVSVDKKGFVTSEKKEIYCSGYEDCYKQ